MRHSCADGKLKICAGYVCDGWPGCCIPMSGRKVCARILHNIGVNVDQANEFLGCLTSRDSARIDKESLPASKPIDWNVSR